MRLNDARFGLLGTNRTRPAAYQSCDKVCILAGAEMPFVLCKVDKGRFFLLGLAYVDDIMDGETIMMDGFEESLRTFEIC